MQLRADRAHAHYFALEILHSLNREILRKERLLALNACSRHDLQIRSLLDGGDQLAEARKDAYIGVLLQQRTDDICARLDADHIGLEPKLAEIAHGIH